MPCKASVIIINILDSGRVKRKFIDSEALSSARRAHESKILPIDNTFIYQTIEIILYAYELEKLFKDEEKNSEDRTNITFGDHCLHV